MAIDSTPDTDDHVAYTKNRTDPVIAKLRDGCEVIPYIGWSGGIR
jgi:hypothetical protein